MKLQTEAQCTKRKFGLQKSIALSDNIIVVYLLHYDAPPLPPLLYSVFTFPQKSFSPILANSILHNRNQTSRHQDPYRFFSYPIAHCVEGREGSSSFACLHHRWEGMCLYGAIGLRSFSALTLNTIDDKMQILNAQMAVLRFHATGVGHHPPEGDHT